MTTLKPLHKLLLIDDDTRENYFKRAGTLTFNFNEFIELNYDKLSAQDLINLS